MSTGPAAEFFISNDGSCIQLFSIALLAITRALYDRTTWDREKKKWWDNFSLYSIAVTEGLLLNRRKWLPHRSNCLVDKPWRLVANGILHLVSSEDMFCAVCHGVDHHLAASFQRIQRVNTDSEVWCHGLNAQWVDTDAFRLLSLILMCGNQYPDIVEYYVERCDLAIIFSSQHVLNLSLSEEYLYVEKVGYQRYEFDCSFIEIFAQLAFYRMEDLRLLLVLGEGMFDPSKVLIAYVGSHYNCDECLSTEKKQGDCIVKRLLEGGADPNATGYFVTPLQVAVFTDQPDLVALLLATGADPNSTGDVEGLKWEGNTILGYFSHLHGYSPLDLIKSEIQAEWVKRSGWDKFEMGNNTETNEQITKLLKQYGARTIRVDEVSAQVTESVSRNEQSSLSPQEGSDNNFLSSQSTSDIVIQDDDIVDDCNIL
ncbi:hypothetical protein N431DRAFT_467149 [Stipitochalara longipes BDJ]|nr:hypothetical protein N431DRAFT_467149 [Stipitochalara longipes BDJ]